MCKFKQLGTTFIELMIALALIGGVITGFLQLNLISVHSQQQLKFSAIALNLVWIYLDAAQSLEQLEIQAAQNLPNGKISNFGASNLKVTWEGGQLSL